MKKAIGLFIAILGLAIQGFGEVARLKYSPEFILLEVLKSKNLTLDPDKPLPKIYYSSEIEVSQFQDAIEPQWHFRPDVVTNAYIVRNNEIYLFDDSSYYEKTKRCIDDSLAHELVHYVQVVYQGVELIEDGVEEDAIHRQNQFRERFCQL